MDLFSKFSTPCSIEHHRLYHNVMMSQRQNITSNLAQFLPNYLHTSLSSHIRPDVHICLKLFSTTEGVFPFGKKVYKYSCIYIHTNTMVFTMLKRLPQHVQYYKKILLRLSQILSLWHSTFFFFFFFFFFFLRMYS